jgi:hypothetical protein
MSLTEFVYYTKKIGPFVVMGLLFVSIMLMVVQIISLLPKKVIVRKPVYDVSFGILNKPNFKGVVSNDFNFSIDTIRGIPTLQIDKDGAEQVATASAQVFFLPTTVQKSTYKTKMVSLAKKLGFSANYAIENSIATFEAETKQLTIDSSNFNFIYEDKQASYGAAIQEQNTIITDAVNFLVAQSRYPNELARGNKVVSYLFYDDKTNEYKTLEKDNIAVANSVLVDFNRVDTNGLNVYSTSYLNSPNYVLLTYTSERKPKIIKANIQFWEKLDDARGFYPIKTVAEAYEALVNGFGNVLFADGRDQKINRIYLGYFEDENYTEYLQPIYVFTNEKKTFVAYVQAVKSEYSQVEVEAKKAQELEEANLSLSSQK